jgi:dihydrolipoamide dehydrogenase
VPERFDVAIIGAGSGGYVAAIRAAQLGLRTAVIEKDKVGGVCLHCGCIPTKALLQTAALLDALHHADRMGVRVGPPELDWAVANRRKQQVVDRLTKGIQFLLRKNKVTTIAGRGRIAGRGTVAITGGDGDRELAADTIIVATGSSPRQLPGLEVDGRTVLSSDEMLVVDHVPRSIVVLGAGAVGVEFASLYRSCGSEVTLVEMLPRLVPLEDHEVGAELQRQFERRGVRCLPGTSLDASSLERNEGGIAVTVATDGKEERLQAEMLLVAVGRRSNLDDLGIEDTRVKVERGMVDVDARMRTAEDALYAVGDIVGGFQLAHKAMHQGVIAAEAIAGRDPSPLDSGLVPRTTYCTPQIGSLGLSEEEAREAGREVSCGVFPLRANSRAAIWGEDAGFCKVVADRATDEVLGVHIVGHEVTELIAGPALGALLEATPFELGHAVAPHPTLSEILGEAALAVSGEAIHI